MRAALRPLMVSLCVAALAASSGVSAQTQPHELRIDALLNQLTLQEKLSLLSGASMFGTAAVERLGIRSMRFADGPNGVRSNDGNEATAFPVGITLASSWNPQLLQQVGAAIGRESRAMGSHVLLGPNLNLVRAPLSGRNFETYGEDPFLTGTLGTSYVRGIQSEGVAASTKHYIGNEQETERNNGNSVMDVRAMHELYLRPFEMAVRDAQPWTVMTAYNRLNGPFMSEHELLVRQILKNKWGFDGVVMSDWFGTHSTLAVNAGLDLEMPGPPQHFGAALLGAVNAGQVPVATIDHAARRMLRLMAHVGALDGDLKPATVVSTPVHRELARAAAAQGITLLKNDRQLLPLNNSALRKLAVIGPNADAVVIEGGGSAQVIPSNLVSPLDAIRTHVDAQTQLVHETGVDNEFYTPAIDGRDLSTDRQRKQRGLLARYYANDKFAGRPVKTRAEQTFGSILMGNDVNLQGNNNLSVTWNGYFWPRRSGEHEFEYEYIKAMDGTGLTAPGARANATIKLDGKLILSSDATPLNAMAVGFFPTEIRRTRVMLVAGKPYPISVAYAGGGYRVQHFRLAVRPPAGSIEAAVAAARDADVALVFVGSGTTAETEGRDRTMLALHGEQDALVQAVVAANPNTVVVLHNGAPVIMPWVDKVPAIVEAWLPGQEGNLALGDILFGAANPSGKLPVTFPKRLQDSPSHIFYPGFRDAVYGESIFMGYRYYDKKELDPLFPFGHGLSYTSFAYSNLQAPAQVRPGESVTVAVDVKNAGKRAGAEVVQVYVLDGRCREACPVRELKAFGRVELQSGETRTVSLQLDERAFAHYDAHAGEWRAQSGRYTIQVGSSSRDMRISGEIVLVQH